MENTRVEYGAEGAMSSIVNGYPIVLTDGRFPEAVIDSTTERIIPRALKSDAELHFRGALKRMPHMERKRERAEASV